MSPQLIGPDCARLRSSLKCTCDRSLRQCSTKPWRGDTEHANSGSSTLTDTPAPTHWDGGGDGGGLGGSGSGGRGEGGLDGGEGGGLGGSEGGGVKWV